MITDRFRFAFALVSVLTLAACGGAESGASAEAAPLAGDTAIKAIAREPLTEADLVGFAMEDLSVELPWTGNRASRDADPVAATALLQALETSGQDAFDRVAFTFSDMTAFPGYSVEIVDSAEDLRCVEDGKAATMTGPSVVVRLTPTSIEDGSNIKVGSGSLRMDRLQTGGVVCAEGQEVVWAAALASGSQVRVLEFRAPNRLVVDVR